MATLTPVYSWVLRPSLQKLPAPPQPHTSQRSVNQQTPPSGGAFVVCRNRTSSFRLTFMCFYFTVRSCKQRRYFHDGSASPVESKPSCHMFSVCTVILCPRTSDGERRNFRNENREKDRHLRRCWHRSRSGLLQLLCSLSILLIILGCDFRKWIWALTINIVEYW